jgi:hypothetical protein
MDGMQRQALKHLSVRLMRKPLLWLAVLIFAWPFDTADAAGGTFTVARPIPRPVIIDPRVEKFYADWVTVQQSNIADIQRWTALHLDQHSALTIKIIAKLPALLDYEFRKTLNINTKQAEQHLIQWLNIHKHSQISTDIIDVTIEDASEATVGDDSNLRIAAVNVEYTAQGVSVLPNGKYKTMRLKTELTMSCQDRIALPELRIITSDCLLQASSRPLRSIK